MVEKSAVSLLSGGLDSVVSLAVSNLEYKIKLAIIFDYGQRAYKKELVSVEKICNHYSIPFKSVKLDWLEDITDTSLVNREKLLPEYTLNALNSDISVLEKSAKAVWVANRNGVMLNIAAAFAESMKCQAVIFGANAEEAVTFPDNSSEYVENLNIALSYSTANKVKIIAPLAQKNKSEIIELAIKNKVPVNLIWSCYTSEDRHCGKCESCTRLKRALFQNNQQKIWSEISSDGI